ncbi:MAG: PAS domain S-box protein [Bacteroidetes bacterium]|nr:PAS domain S-box protein [Bacteroidota bacterium]
MKEANSLRAIVSDPKLKVSYKATPASLNSFLNNLPDAVIITDPEFIIKAFNHAAETFFGLPASHFIGTVLEEHINFRFRYTSKEEAMRVLFETGIWNGHIVVNREEGEEFIFHANVSLLYDERAKVSSIVFVNHNITEEEQQGRKLQSVRNKYEIVVESLSDGVMLIDDAGIVVASNSKARIILGMEDCDIKGASLANANWKAIKADGSPFPIDEYPAIVSLRTGEELNDVILGLNKPGGEMVWLSINSRPIFKDGTSVPDAVVASFKDITKEKTTKEQLFESELLFRSFMANSPTLGWIYDERGYLVYGNPLFIERVGLRNNSLGKHLHEISSPETAAMVLERNRTVLEKGETVITEDELVLKDGTKKYFLANWFLIPGKPYRLIGGQAIDITEKKMAQEYIEKMHERFTYVVNASSDAIWDLDLRTNEIYRSDAFSKISGYSKEEIEPTLEWWFNKIHPEDKQRVHDKVEADLANHSTTWEDEYRFEHADGSYRYIHDKGFAIYDNGVAVRQVGSMQDITERKKLEQQLMQEHVQKQKLINQATINAQEEERNRISAELHDNVNQLLISSRLHIGVAKNNPANQDELLNKATEYLLMAVEEIRALSKKMNSHIVSSVGLFESVSDIGFNMKKLNGIDTITEIDKDLIAKLSTEQQLMVFRIVQEQTNNIIKHSGATEATISLQQKEGNANLVITDNGKGFDKREQKKKGLGFVNMFNRIDAYNGKMEVISAPGKGCRIELNFPCE